MNANFVIALWLWGSVLLIAVILIAVAIYHNRRKTPVNFWSGSIIEPEEITDTPAYNRANYLMWTFFIICLAVSVLFMLFSILIGSIVFGVALILGTVLMMIVHKRIYNKYKTEKSRYRIEI